MVIPKHVVLYALTLVLLCACGKQAARIEDEKDIVLSINIDSLSTAKLSVKNARYIPLETTEASLIGGITKLLYVDHQFYILDREGQNVTVFSDTGEYQYRIAKMGQGPGEYVGITDMDVAPNGDIYVNDNASRKIIRYSQKGERFEEIPIGEQYIMSFSLSSDSSQLYLADMLIEGKIAVDLARYDIAKGTYASIKDYEYATSMSILSFGPSRFFRSGEKVYHYHRFTPYIAIMDNGNKYIKLATERIPSKEQVMKADNADYHHREIFTDGFIYDIAAFYETDNMIHLLTYTKYIMLQWSFVRKSDPRMSHTFDTMSVPQSLMLFSNICGATDSHFVSYFEPTKERVAQLMASDSAMNKADSMLLANLGEDDNPVLALFQCEITEEKE
jgi:hypothetical protein